MKAIIEVDIPDYQIGQEVSIYFKDTMMIKGIVQEPKTGHWIEVENYSDVKHKIKCSNCEEHIFSKGHARSQYTREHYPFCSMCGARMFEPQESEG